MAELKENEDNKDYQFKIVVTTEWVDRDWEVIKADWIEFKNYMKNPVVLVDHSYKIESIVWKTTKIYQEWGKTIAEWVFAKGIEKAELIRSLYNQWFVKTVSIWFIPKQRDDKDSDIISKSEMLEFSFVAVPANPEALSLDWKTYQKCIDLWLVKEVEKKIDFTFLWNLSEIELEIASKIYEKFEDKIKELQLIKETEIDTKDILNNINLLRDDFSEMKAGLKTFADDKEKENNNVKLRELGKEFQKSLSTFNAEMKAQV